MYLFWLKKEFLSFPNLKKEEIHFHKVYSRLLPICCCCTYLSICISNSHLCCLSLHIFLFPNHLFILCKIFALSKYLRRQVFFLKLCFSWAKRKKRTVCIVAVTSRAPKNTTKKKTWNKSFSQAPHPGGSAL